MAGTVVVSANDITVWEIDPVHTSVQFSVRHMMISKVRGEFKVATGSLRFDEKNLANTSVSATIDATSVNTREPDRDTHLKSADFLDTAHYPEITFLSTSIEKTPRGKYKIHGDLTIHGVTKNVSLLASSLSPAVKDPWGHLRRGTSATARLNRKAFGLKWNQVLETGGVMVGDEISVTIDVELVEKNEQTLVAPDETVVAVGA